MPTSSKLWADVRQYTPWSSVRDAANEHMATLEQSAVRVMTYFQDPWVKFAASSYFMGQ